MMEYRPRPGTFTREEAWAENQSAANRKWSIDDRKRDYSLFTKCFAEFIGDLTFVYVGTMQTFSVGDNLLHAALAHGFTIFIIVTTLGHISGGHFNPAVSWAVAGTGKLPLLHLPFYVFSQLLGGFCGALLTAAVLTNEQLQTIQAGATLVSTNNYWWQGLIGETIVTFLLVHTILNTAVDSDSVTLAPLAIGLTLSIDILSTGTITGASMNPARSLGPNIVGSIFLKELYPTFWSNHWVYWAGPIAGSTIALAVHRPNFAQLVKTVLQELEWDPDHVPSDYHLFPFSLKLNVTFNDKEDLKNSLKNFFDTRPDDFWSNGINNLRDDILQFLLPLACIMYTFCLCSCNDRAREQIHIQRRQALRNRQRQAAASGRSVRSVIETEIEQDDVSCPKLSCVRMAPRLKTNVTDDVYQRLNKNDNSSMATVTDKEKPPGVEERGHRYYRDFSDRGTTGENTSLTNEQFQGNGESVTSSMNNDHL